MKLSFVRRVTLRVHTYLLPMHCFTKLLSIYFEQNLCNFIKLISLLPFSNMSVATHKILKEKSFDNETIVLNEMKPAENMIKGKGPRGQKNFLLRTNRQKTL
jgi:hypothetical protein